MVQQPYSGLTQDPMEVDHNDLTAGPQGFVNRSHRLVRKLEVVVGIADKDQIDGFRRQLHGVGGADDADNVFDVCFLAGLLDMLDELGGDVHGVHRSLGAELLGEEVSEQAGPGTDVGHGHLWLELAGRNDFLSLDEDFPALGLERPDEFLHVGVLERLVDARADAFFLTRSQGNERHEGQCNQKQPAT